MLTPADTEKVASHLALPQVEVEVDELGVLLDDLLQGVQLQEVLSLILQHQAENRIRSIHLIFENAKKTKTKPRHGDHSNV